MVRVKINDKLTEKEMKKVCVIGGGAAGLMAAYAAAEKGHEVALFEKNEKLGKKIYITGKGRCNFTNDVSVEEFLPNIVRGEKFLRGALYAFFASKYDKFLRKQRFNGQNRAWKPRFSCL